MDGHVVLNTFCDCWRGLFDVSWRELFFGPQDLEEELVEEPESLCRL